MRIRIRWLKKQPKLLVTAAGLALVAVIGVAGYLTGSAITFGVFYLIPVLLVATAAGKMRGLLVATIAASVWLMTDLLGAGPKPSAVIILGNELDRLAVLFVVALLASTVSDLNEEREHAIEQRTDELPAGEKGFRQLTESIGEVFWMTDPSKAQMLYVSPTYEQIWGRPCASLYAAPTSWVESIHPDDRERISQRVMTSQVSGKYDEEYRILRPDGSIRWIHDRAFPITDDTGAIYRIAGIAEDITERKLIENALGELQRQQRALLDNIPDIAWLKDKEGGYIAVNDAYVKASGISHEEYSGKTAFDIWPRELAERYVAGDKFVMESRQRKRFEEPFVDVAGNHTWIETIKTPIFDDQGEVIGTVGIGRDITERKLAEIKAATLVHAVESTSELICITDLRDRFIFVNRAFQKAYGYTEEEILEKTCEVLFSPRNPPSLVGEILEQTRLGGWRGEVLDRRKDGTEFPIRLSTSLVKDSAGQVIGLMGVAQDITERKLAEEELRWKTAFLEAQVNSSIDGILVVDQHGKKILQNQRLNELWKIPQHITDDPDDENQIQWVASMTRNPEEFVETVEYLYSHPDEISRDERELKDGTILDRYSSPVIGKDGKHYGRIWTFRDITERKQVEATLQRQQAELRVLFDLIPAMIWFKDTENRILRVNKRAAETAGKSVQEIEGKSTFEIHPEEAAKFYAGDLEVIRSGAPKLGIVETLRDQGGKELWIQTDKVPYCDKDGKVIGVVVLAQDITQRRRTEESLRLLGTAVEQSRESIVITDPQLDLPGPRILFVNPAFTNMTGYTAAEVLGKTPRILQGSRTDKTVLSAFRQTLTLGEPFLGETINYRKDGTEFFLEWQVTPIRDASGAITHYVASARDITQRKLAENTLRESQQQLKDILDNTTAAIYMKDLAGRFILVNRYFESIFHVRREEFVGKTDLDLFTREQATAFQQNDLQVLAASAPLEFEEIVPHDDGLHTYISIKFPLRDTQGVPYSVCSISTDITERKRLEKEILEISDREQARIGRDLHDDLCQRLVSIAFASNLLEKRLREKSLVGAADASTIARQLDESITQARTLARVLYPVKLESEGLAAALQELAISVSNRPTLLCEVDCPGPVPIGDIAVATHLYRIAQEAVSNAVRHAQASRIVIGLQMRDGGITLSVTDNGIGLSDDVNQRHGMGLHTMQYRARMIDGRLEIKRAESGGTRVTCRIQVRPS